MNKNSRRTLEKNDQMNTLTKIAVPIKLLSDVRMLIDTARENVARSVNSFQTMLYWDIGLRVQKEVLKSKRAEYGKEIVATLSQQLVWSQCLVLESRPGSKEEK